MRRVWPLLILSALALALALEKPGTAQGRPLASYGADLTTTGCAIAHSAYSGEPASNAFDNNTGTRWGSGEVGAATSNVSWVGCDFGAGSEKHIEQVTAQFWGASDPNDDNFVELIAVQYADTTCTDSGIWTTAAIIDPVHLTSNLQTFGIPYAGNHQCWRFLAAVRVTGSSRWLIREIEMMEQNATATPTATAVLSPTPTGTLTPTVTLTPTQTLTPTATPPEFNIVSTLAGGDAVYVSRSSSFGDLALFALGSAILVVLILMLVIQLTPRSQGG